MTVQEAITELQKLPADVELVIAGPYAESGYYQVGEIKQITVTENRRIWNYTGFPLGNYDLAEEGQQVILVQ